MKCRKHTESKNPNVAGTKNERIILSSNYYVCDGKTSKFIKQRDACV